jgi:hypothetical protein
MAHVETPPERCGFRDGVCCVVIALCAISGKPPEEIGKVLQQARLSAATRFRPSCAKTTALSTAAGDQDLGQ